MRHVPPVAACRIASRPPAAASEKTARLVNRFAAEAARVLKNEAPTNMVTLRGFARYPKIATMKEISIMALGAPVYG